MLQPQGKFAVLPFSGGGQDQMDISRDSVLVHQNSYIANQIVVVSNTYMDIEYQNSVLSFQYLHGHRISEQCSKGSARCTKG